MSVSHVAVSLHRLGAVIRFRYWTLASLPFPSSLDRRPTLALLVYIIGASCRKCHFCRDKHNFVATTSIPLSRQTLVFLAGAAYDIYIDRSGLHVQVTRDMRAIGSE